MRVGRRHGVCSDALLWFFRMSPKLAAITALTCCFSFGGTELRQKPGDYPAHATSGQLAIAAEYLVHSFSGHNQSFVTKDYLVVEVALFPMAGSHLHVDNGQFKLRINGRKEAILAQAPAFVAASLKYPDWENRRRAMATVGAGNGEVIVGAPERIERFPGDPRPRQTRLPQPPRSPQEDRSGIEKEPPVRADEVVVAAALEEGQISGPRSGYLYFPYKGKSKSIKSIELIHQGPAGGLTLRLL